MLPSSLLIQAEPRALAWMKVEASGLECIVHSSRPAKARRPAATACCPSGVVITHPLALRVEHLLELPARGVDLHSLSQGIVDVSGAGAAAAVVSDLGQPPLGIPGVIARRRAIGDVAGQVPRRVISEARRY